LGVQLRLQAPTVRARLPCLGSHDGLCYILGREYTTPVNGYHEGMHATDRLYQGACDRQSLPSGVKTRENAQNEANPELTQSSLPLEVESSVSKPQTS